MTDQPQRLSGCGVLKPRDDIEQHNSLKVMAGGTRDAGQKPKGTSNRRKTADRFAVLNSFIDITMANLTRNEIAVWLVLYRDSRDEIARTSQVDIARRAGVTDRTVRNVMRKLERRGLLKIVYRGGLNSGPSRYRVIPLEPEQTT